MSFGPVIKIAFLFTLSSVSSFSSPMVLEGHDNFPQKRSTFGRQISILNYVKKSGEVLSLSSSTEWGKENSPKKIRQNKRKKPLKSTDSYWNIPEVIASKKSIEVLPINEGDKENISPDLFSTKEEEKKKQQAQFMKLFRQPSDIKYDLIKKKFLEKKWSISEKGNPYIRILSSEAPDNKEHYIVITQSTNKDTSKIEYSAFIDTKSYSSFIEHQPLSPVWFSDHDSIKRAALTIIYK